MTFLYWISRAVKAICPKLKHNFSNADSLMPEVKKRIVTDSHELLTFIHHMVYYWGGTGLFLVL